jgi:hypothetical protein
MLRGLALFKGIESPKNKVEYQMSSSSIDGGAHVEESDPDREDTREEIECFEPMLLNKSASPLSLKKYGSSPSEKTPTSQNKAALQGGNMNFSKLSSLAENSLM